MWENGTGFGFLPVGGYRMWGEHRDPAMSMLGVVPGEEGAAESGRDGGVFEAPGETGMVLQGFELRLGEGVVVADLGGG